MKVNSKQLEEVIKLSGQRRYEYFVKVVADWEEAWRLYNNGWALAATEDGKQVFPIWPAKEFAELCIKDEWSGYAAVSFSLDEMLNELLPNLKNDDVLPGIFYTPLDKGTTPSADQLASDLNHELDNYCSPIISIGKLN